MMSRMLCFIDLKDVGIAENLTTLFRRIKGHGFPPGILLDPNSRGWAEADVLSWLSSRPVKEDLEGGK